MIEVGDHHGTMVARPNLRPGDWVRGLEGGLARIATLIKEARRQDPHALVFNCGDTLQGSAEALYTKGQSMVDVLDTFGINGYALGNWDWLYGKGRWNVVVANAYHADTGQRIFPAYRVLKVKGIKIGIIGMTAARGLPAVPEANKGVSFTDGEAELAEAIDYLRNTALVDLVVLLSELGLAKNTLLVERYKGVVPRVNPISGAILRAPIDTVVGDAETDIYHGNFSHHPTLPGVIGGTSHEFISDAFRVQAGTDIATLRGFRYGTYVSRGKITVCAINLTCAQHLTVLHSTAADWAPLDHEANYSVAGYWFAGEPARVGPYKNTSAVRVLTHADGSPKDATEIGDFRVGRIPGAEPSRQFRRGESGIPVAL